MSKRSVLMLKWLQDNPGWHTMREIGVKALHLDKTKRWGSEALIGPLKKLQKMGKVEFGRGKIPGALEVYRAKER